MTFQDIDSLVISRAVKASGKNKYWFNIKDLDGKTMNRLDFENIISWKNLSEEILLCERESFEMIEAKPDELEN